MYLLWKSHKAQKHNFTPILFYNTPSNIKGGQVQTVRNKKGGLNGDVSVVCTNGTRFHGYAQNYTKLEVFLPLTSLFPGNIPDSSMSTCRFLGSDCLWDFWLCDRTSYCRRTQTPNHFLLHYSLGIKKKWNLVINTQNGGGVGGDYTNLVWDIRPLGEYMGVLKVRWRSRKTAISQRDRWKRARPESLFLCGRQTFSQNPLRDSAA